MSKTPTLAQASGRSKFASPSDRLSPVRTRTLPRRTTPPLVCFPKRFPGIVSECKAIIVKTPRLPDASAERVAASPADPRSHVPRRSWLPPRPARRPSPLRTRQCWRSRIRAVARRQVGSNRGVDPRCPGTPLALGPVPAGRASTMKSPPRSSPSWRPAACPGSSHGEQRRRRRRWPCQRTPAPVGSIPGSTC